MQGSGWHMQEMYGMGGFMWFWWIVILIVIVAVVWMAMSGARRGNSVSRSSPEDVLKRRYAAGEIDRETYERMLEDLRR